MTGTMAARTRTEQSGQRGWLRIAASLLVFVAAGAVAGCSTIDVHATKPVAEATVPIPPAAPKTTGVDSPAMREHKQLVRLFGGEYHSVATERLLDETLAKIVPASDMPTFGFKLTILNSPVVNAFALPSGRIYVTRGLLALANDNSEIAAVMAHEIAHVTARHAFQRAEAEKRQALFSQAASVIDDPAKSQTFQAASQRTLTSFSQQQEFEADEIGIHTIAKAGYDPFAAARFLQSLARSTTMRQSILGGAGGGNRPDINSTHPSTPERIERAIAEARQISAPGIGQQGRDRYLDALVGLPFGDDPAEGFVRGPKFIHPKLGFTFTAPDGFVLENSTQAVLGIADGGQEALRLDRVHVDPATTLQSYLASGWIDGLQQSTVQNVVINGFPAALATAKGSDWYFRLAAIRFGDEVYRLIFATKSLSDETENRFTASINSFRKITPDEVKDVKPMRLDVVTAGAGDTPDTLAARMQGQDRPLDLFLVLNGLDPGATLKPGERYKIVLD